MKKLNYLQKKDLVIMACLRNNSRESLTKMSRKTSIPVSTIYERLKQYESEFIKKNTTILDFQKLGFSTRANVLVKAKKESKDNLKEHLIKTPNVNSVYKVNNGFDFSFEVIFRSITELEDFLEKMEDNFSIENKSVYYIIDELQRESFLSNPDTVFLV